MLSDCNAQPVFPQATYVPEPPCADSIGLAIQKASMRYTSYKDSLTNVFDSAYTARCLKASENEAFRLIRPQREYHYTLYYYDQAGNLVKTVAPKGVGLFRDSLATTWGFQKDSVGHILDSLIKRVRATELTGGVLLLNYAYATQYRYNSLNQVIAQQTPDAGRSAFWYDTLGRLAISQQSQQKLDSLYSYTLYDVLGRIAEVGEKKQAGAMSQTISRSPAALLTWLNTNHSTQPRRQITRTGYDFVSRPFGVADRFQQQNLRTRVSFSLYQDEDAAELSTISPKSVQPGSVYKQATYYTYDVHGNVNYLLQHYRQGGLFTAASGAHQYKIVRYAYDLISGKVNQVTYQPTWYAEGTAIVPADQYYHRYGYDAENRLTEVYVSRDSVYWERDASYQYYRHGPLARTELGHNRVQGLDYAYTLQGWLKGVNSTGLFRNGLNDDMGKDATPTASPAPGYGDNSLVAEDAFGFALHYNHKDYKPAGGSLLKPFVEIDVQQLPINNQDTGYYQPLYNGNIAGMTTNIPMLTAPIRSGRNYTEYSHFYKYDQLNRLVAAESFPFIFRSTNHIRFWRTITSAEQFSYDANGNFTFVNRNAILPGGAPGSMDILTYNYTDYTNRLTRVKDSRPAGNYLTDIDNQPTNNYAYNAIGNLVSDNADSITRIAWTVYGKIDSIYKSNGTLISYRYDAGGNRILKKVNNTETIYVRDASGNVMSTYTNDSAGLWQKEIHLYGSSRIGIQQIALNLTDPDPEIIKTVGEITGKARTFDRGNKFFELSNHLGNVLVTVSDRRRSLANTGTPALISRYQPVVISAQDYLSFGMIMPGRSYESGAYRYGFNGKENDNEVKGTGNQQDYGMRIYDPRVGRFLSIDGLTHKYPWYSPYQFAGNKPIWAIDVDGLEEYIKTYKYEDGKATQLSVVKNSYIVKEAIVVNRYRAYRDVVYDRRTGKPMNPSEIGQVQHFYKDKDGNKLNIRRNYKGDYVSGTSEMMSTGTNNILGSIYIGPTNPTYKDENGQTQYDYRREPQDEVDAAAMQHDMNYDKANAAGAGDAFFNRNIAPADQQLVNDAKRVKEKANAGGIDNVTGKPVSAETLLRAGVVSRFFGWILKAPAFKGEMPKSDGKEGTHVIK